MMANTQHYKVYNVNYAKKLESMSLSQGKDRSEINKEIKEV